MRRLGRLVLIASLLVVASAGRAWADTCQDVFNRIKANDPDYEHLLLVLAKECKEVTVGDKTQWISYASINAFFNAIVVDDDLRQMSVGSHASADLRPSAFQTRVPSSGPRFTLSLVAEVGVGRGDGATLLLVQGGVRLKAHLTSSPRIVPFVQVVAGVEHCGVCQYSSFALQPGGGILYRISPRLQLFGEGDLRIVPSSENGLAVGGGVTFVLSQHK
jgi:hypothetical protein